MYVKVAKDCYVPKENIKLYMAYSGNAVKTMVKKLKEENKILDLSGRKKASTVVLLKTGEGIITSNVVDTISGRTEITGA